MRVIFRDLKHCVLKLRVENLDDLWYLSQVVSEGDLVKGETARRVKDKDDVKSSGGERKLITLGVRAERIEFKGETSSLRISGIIEEGPGDIVALGSHHTLNVDLDGVITIIKSRWSRVLLGLVENAVKATWRPKVLVVAVDDGEATLGLLRESSIQYSEISRNIGGKYDIKGRAERKKGFYGELSSIIENVSSKENAASIILAGAGFEKDNFLKFLSESNRELAARCIIENTGASGRNAIGEVVKRPTLRRSMEEASSAMDVRLVDELLRNIGKDSGLGCYGLADVEAAARAGAVESLLISDGMFFKKRGKSEELMKTVEQDRGRVHLINHEGEAGKQLDSIGGIAALLRYKLKY